YTAHFDAIGEDGRFSRLPLAAASTLMAKGYGYAAEGDVLTSCLVAAGHTLIGDAHFTEMYAMDFPSDSVLMSHMGEGNWKIARSDRPVKLIKRPLGIGRLADPPTFLFQYQPGPAGHAGVAGGRAVPAGGRGGREPGHAGTARAGDALWAVPARLRRAGLPERLAAGWRPAPRGDEPRPSRGVVAGLLPARGHRVRAGLGHALASRPGGPARSARPPGPGQDACAQPERTKLAYAVTGFGPRESGAAQ